MLDKHKTAVWYRKIPGWLWRLTCSALLGGLTLFTLLPWAEAQRGYPAIGGEHMVVLVLFILTFCIDR